MAKMATNYCEAGRFHMGSVKLCLYEKKRVDCEQEISLNDAKGSFDKFKLQQN